MKNVIYVVHIDAVSEDFNTLSNDDIKELYTKEPELVLRYDNIYDFANDWNNNYENMYYPDDSYIRIIEEE